jgi:WD40 repeat protein
MKSCRTGRRPNSSPCPYRSPEVSGLNDLGEKVDYESVFTPDVQDQVSSITCIRATSGSRTIHFGTIDGTVVRYDAALKRIEQLKKRHASAVIDFCHTPHGIISIGTDRLAQLFDMPLTPQSQDPNAELSFQLPPDATLEDAETPPLPETSVALESKSTRPVKARMTEALVVPDLSLMGIRPADSALALYGHQLRAAETSEKRLAIRKLILKHRGEGSQADSLGNELEEIEAGPPVRVGDTSTQMQFGDGEWSRVQLAVSDDGTMVAAFYRGSLTSREPNSATKALSLFDVTTATTLRHWTQPVNSSNLSLNLPHQILSPEPAATRFWHNTGYAATDPMRPVAASTFSPDSSALILGRAGSVGLAEPALTRMNLETKTETHGLELFETMVTAVGFSSAGDRLIVGTRERDQVRLLELNPVTMAIQQEILREHLNGRISEQNAEVPRAAMPGTSFILLSQSDKLMLTMGNYDGGFQLRLWRIGRSGWLQEDVTVIRAPEANPDFNSIDRPIVFVNQQDARIAILNTSGLLILATKKGTVERMIPIPNVNGHRPPCVFTPDGNWLLTGDGDGNVWAASMMSLDRKPIRFEAHIGPIAGLAVSANGRYLATIGEDNHLRSWRVDGFLKR